MKIKRVFLGEGYLRHDFYHGFMLAGKPMGLPTRGDIFSGRIVCIINTAGKPFHGKRIRLVAEILEQNIEKKRPKLKCR